MGFYINFVSCIRLGHRFKIYICPNTIRKCVYFHFVVVAAAVVVVDDHCGFVKLRYHKLPVVCFNYISQTYAETEQNGKT